MCVPPTQFGGAGEIRTRDPLLAKQVLYQLSYDPEIGRTIAVKNFWFSIFTLCDQLRPGSLSFLRPSARSPM